MPELIVVFETDEGVGVRIFPDQESFFPLLSTNAIDVTQIVRVYSGTDVSRYALEEVEASANFPAPLMRRELGLPCPCTICDGRGHCEISHRYVRGARSACKRCGGTGIILPPEVA